MLATTLRRRSTQVVLVAALFGVAWAVAQTTGSSDYLEVQSNLVRSGLDPKAPNGGPSSFGTGPAPLSLGSLRPQYEATDVTLASSLGTFGLSRHYTGSPRVWYPFGEQNKVPVAAGAPFGDPGLGSARTSLSWWHGLFSYVIEVPQDTKMCTQAGCEPYVLQREMTLVRLPSGGSVEYPLEPTRTGFLKPRSPNADGSKLFRAASGEQYVHYVPGVGRYFYSLRASPLTDYAKRYRVFYLTHIETDEYRATTADGAGRLITLQYAGGAGPAGCGGSETFANASSLPHFVTEAKTGTGAVLQFNYGALRNGLSADSPLHCVLRSVALKDRNTSNTDGFTVATYRYLRRGDGSEVGGTLGEVEYEGGRIVRYRYGTLEQPTFEVYETNVGTTEERLQQRIPVQSTLSGGTNPYGPEKSGYALGQESAERSYALSSVGADGGVCEPWQFGHDGYPNCRDQKQKFGRNAKTGAGTGAGTYHVRAFHVGTQPSPDWGSVGGGAVTAAFEDSCSPSVASCLPGVEKWEQTELNVGEDLNGPRSLVLTSAHQHKGNGVESSVDKWVYSLASPDAGSPHDAANMDRPVEISELHLGVSRDLIVGTADSAPAQKARFSYVYEGGEGTAERPFELSQLLSRTAIDSSVNPAGESVTFRHYDAVTKRLRAIVREGYTRTLAQGDEPVLQRVGLFYYTQAKCSGGGPEDPLGRTVEVHGPCLVSKSDATECDGGGPIPVLRYAYYPLEAGGNDAGQLQSVTRYTTVSGAPGGLQCTGALTKRFSLYDSRGRPVIVEDAAGVVTVNTYDGERLKETSVAGSVTRYHYDGNGLLVATERPSGAVERYCYRQGPYDPGCQTGVLTDRIQWRATTSLQSYKAYERVESTWNAGNLEAERFYDADGVVRRVVRYEADPLDRPTFQAWGEGAGSFQEVKVFGPHGQVAGLGQAYHAPPGLCDGLSNDRPISPACVAFGYDKARRLAAVRGRCFSYDAQGNLSEAATCPSQVPQESTPPHATTYVHDDFGNVVTVRGPWLSGAVRFEYDAAGNMVAKMTPEMGPARSWVAYEYDGAGRVTRALSRSQEGDEQLFAYEYDGTPDPSVTPACGGVAASPNPAANSVGRLRVRHDTFGATHFRYDTAGRVVSAARRRENALAAAQEPLDSCYRYSTDGRLLEEVYPHGRRVLYAYPAATAGNPERVSAIQVGRYGADGTQVTAPLISDIRWEPFGALRSYAVETASGKAHVEYLLGDNASAAPAGGCGARPITPGDATGRLRAIWVSSSAPGTGDIFKRAYTWKADQLVREDTCLLGNTTPRTLLFGTREATTSDGYDSELQLLHASRPAGQFAQEGGAWGRRDYTYDARGNRRTERSDCASFNYVYADASRPDQLTRREWAAADCRYPGMAVSPVRLSTRYAYDGDGRVTARTQLPDSLGTARGLSFSTDVDGAHAAVGAVYRSVTVDGAFTYGYFYDANGRRRLKQYPVAGKTDEYFWDGDKLLEDRGNVSSTAASDFVLDEYVWLDGRPVAMLKSRLSAGWARGADGVGDCTRNSVFAACGFYFPVTDYLKKPVLMLDGARRVAGAADHDPFGHVNRVQYPADTGAGASGTYAANSRRVLAYLNQRAQAGECVEVQPRYALRDVAPGDGPYLTDSQDVALSGTAVAGCAEGAALAGWTPVPPDGRWRVAFRSGAAPWGAGVVLEGYDFRRYQQGAKPVWTPLRFPGQYHDAETDLFENWNRYYDPSIGRYLGPEPMLGKPDWVMKEAARGRATAAYAYARNNPIVVSDPSGLFPPDWVMDNRGAALRNMRKECEQGNKASCHGYNAMAITTIVLASWYTAPLLIGGGAAVPAATATATATATAGAVAAGSSPAGQQVVAQTAQAAQTLYGPFYRLQGPLDNARAQMSGVLGGEAARNSFSGLFPAVKGYVGNLPAGQTGIEFMTRVPPSSLAPTQALWQAGSQGVMSGTMNGNEAAFVEIVILKASGL